MAFTLVIDRKGLFGKVKSIQMAELLKNCGLKYGSNNEFYILEDKDLLLLHEKKLRRMLDVAVMEGAETIILGAFGCGAFCNNPEVVALANKNVIKDYLHAFKNIEYAVYCSPGDDRNYRIFERVLRLV